MAYYTALQTAWNSVTQPPTGVTGSGLLGGDTTAQKITKVNAWTVTGAVPTTTFTTGDQIFNCVNYPEFKALTAAQQSNVMAMCSTPGQLKGGKRKHHIAACRNDRGSLSACRYHYHEFDGSFQGT